MGGTCERQENIVGNILILIHVLKTYINETQTNICSNLSFSLVFLLYFVLYSYVISNSENLKKGGGAISRAPSGSHNDVNLFI